MTSNDTWTTFVPVLKTMVESRARKLQISDLKCLGLIIPIPKQMDKHPSISVLLGQIMEEVDEHPRISVLVDQLMEEMQRLDVDQGVFMKEAARIYQGRRDRRAMKKVEDVPGLRSLVSEFNLGEDTKKFNRTDASSKSTYDCEVSREGKIGYYRGKYDENCIIGEKDASRPICCIFDDDQEFLQIILLMLDYADAHQDERHVAPASYRRSLRELLPPHIPNGPNPRVDIRGVMLIHCTSRTDEFTDLSDASIVNVLRVGEQLFDKKEKWAKVSISQLQRLSVKETLETNWKFIVSETQSPPRYTLFPGGKNQLLAVKRAKFFFLQRTFAEDMGDTLLADFFTKVDGRQRHDLSLEWCLTRHNENIDFSNTLRTLSDSKFRGEVQIATNGHSNLSNQTFDNGLQIIVKERRGGNMVHIHFENDNELLH